MFYKLNRHKKTFTPHFIVVLMILLSPITLPGIILAMGVMCVVWSVAWFAYTDKSALKFNILIIFDSLVRHLTFNQFTLKCDYVHEYVDELGMNTSFSVYIINVGLTFVALLLMMVAYYYLCRV